MPKIRVAAPLFCPTIKGVIGETIKPRTIEDGQNRDIFGPAIWAAGQSRAIRPVFTEKSLFRAFAGLAIRPLFTPSFTNVAGTSGQWLRNAKFQSQRRAAPGNNAIAHGADSSAQKEAKPPRN
jgi:hypothetical protein